jgi:hypothetical protein
VGAPLKIEMTVVLSSIDGRFTPCCIKRGPKQWRTGRRGPGLSEQSGGGECMRMGFVSPAISELTSSQAALNRSLP